MKNIFLIALSFIINLKIYISQNILIDFCLSFIQFYLLGLYLLYNKIKKFLIDKITK